MPSSLTNKQKGALAKLARRAFALVCAQARGRGEEPETNTKAFDRWRHEQVLEATGKNGLRCCDQDDFLKVRGHFHTLLGEDGKAFNDYMREGTDERRRAEVLLLQNLEKFGFKNDYAEAICMRMFKCHVLEASKDQLMNLVYTVRKRGYARRRKEKVS